MAKTCVAEERRSQVNGLMSAGMEKFGSSYTISRQSHVPNDMFIPTSDAIYAIRSGDDSTSDLSSESDASGRSMGDFSLDPSGRNTRTVRGSRTLASGRHDDALVESQRHPQKDEQLRLLKSGGFW